AAFSGHALAGTLTVNVAGDPAGPGTCPTLCSLRLAIDTAVNGDTVLFAPSLPTPINLTGGALAINKFLLIQGPGAAKLTVSGQNATQVLHVGGQAIISG